MINKGQAGILTNQHTVYKIWYVFGKERGVFEILDYNNFSDALSDNNEAIQKFKELYPDGKFPNNDKVNLNYHYCPVKMSLLGLKPNTGVGFINPSLKAGVIKLKPLSIRL